MMNNPYFAHESSYVDRDCKIGEGTKIWHFSHIMEGCQIGRCCNIGQNVVISPGVVLGDGCKVQNNVSIYTGVVCEDSVFLGPSCVFTTIVCGHNIGRYAFVGAGSVVTEDVPDYALIYGVPARVKGYVCQCGERLQFSQFRAVCRACGKTYRMDIDHHTVEETDGKCS